MFLERSESAQDCIHCDELACKSWQHEAEAVITCRCWQVSLSLCLLSKREETSTLHSWALEMTGASLACSQNSWPTSTSLWGKSGKQCMLCKVSRQQAGLPFCFFLCTSQHVHFHLHVAFLMALYQSCGVSSSKVLCAGNVHLLMPAVQIDDVEAAVNDNDVIAELEHVMSAWCAALTDVMQREAEKNPIGSGPLAGQLPLLSVKQFHEHLSMCIRRKHVMRSPC